MRKARKDKKKRTTEVWKGLEISDMVVELSEELTENDIRTAVANIRKRAQKCLEGERPDPNNPKRQIPCPGGHFQHLLRHSPGH